MGDRMTTDINDMICAAKTLTDGVRELHNKIKTLEAKVEAKRRRSEYWRAIADAQRREIKQLKEKLNDPRKSSPNRAP